MDNRQLVKRVDDLESELEYQKKKAKELQSIAVKHQEEKIEKVRSIVVVYLSPSAY